MTALTLVTALTALAPSVVAHPTADGAAPSLDAQWAALRASPRVLTDKGTGGTATAVAVGWKEDVTYLLTARHAVPDTSAVTFDFFYRPADPHAVWHPDVTGVVRAAESADADFVLLKVADTRRQIPTIKLAPPGKRPKAFPFDAASVGCGGGHPPTCRAESIRAKVFARDGTAVAFFWEASQPPQPGRSGGPLLAKDGTVIGLCTAAKGNTGYYTHADEILAVLKEKGYGWLWEE